MQFYWRPYLGLQHEPNPYDKVVWTAKTTIIGYNIMEMHHMSRPTKLMKSPPSFICHKDKENLKEKDSGFGSQLSKEKVIGTSHFPCNQGESPTILGLLCLLRECLLYFCFYLFICKGYDM